jgi:uncharacterized phage infection (PIP) family protein YhgE
MMVLGLVLFQAVQGLVLASSHPPPSLEARVKHLATQLNGLEKSPSKEVAAEAKELEKEADLALTHGDAAKLHVLAAARNWTEDLAARQKVLTSKSELERLEANAVHLEAKVDDNATRALLAKAVKDEDAGELRHALRTAVGDLQAKIERLNAEQANLSTDIRHAKEGQLMRLLRERQTLPMETQKAVLRRKEFEDFPLAQKLMESKNETSLFSQLRSLDPEIAVPDEDVHHSKGVHSESRRVYVVSSKMKHLVKDMRTKLGSIREQLKNAVAAKKGDASAVDAGSKILNGLDAVLNNMNNTHDLQKQLKQLEDFQEGMLKDQSK